MCARVHACVGVCARECMHVHMGVWVGVCAGGRDISKAFDKVWHDGLIFKLKQNGISGSLLHLLENYLLNRKQRVVLNGSFSDYSVIESGVPQGSVLGPLLFLTSIPILNFLLTTPCCFL